jgi:hypothetical protein
MLRDLVAWSFPEISILILEFWLVGHYISHECDMPCHHLVWNYWQHPFIQLDWIWNMELDVTNVKYTSTEVKWKLK